MNHESVGTPRPFHPHDFRDAFPLFKAEENKNLAYLDNAATSQKPQVVIDALVDYYSNTNSNIHRGVYRLSVESTNAYDRARTTVANALNAASPGEIVFVRGATEGINLVARAFLQERLNPGDEILLTVTEHHANFVPWQMVAQATGAQLRLIPLLEDQTLDLEAGLNLITKRTKILAMAHGSNATGNLMPAKALIEAAHRENIPVLLDACQSAAHERLDVRELNCDFLVFSGHKVFGPTGIGVLYGKREHLESMPPYQGGGDMIDKVSLEETTFAPPPQKFEAGTPNIAGAIGLAAAIDFFLSWDLEAVRQYESELLDHLRKELGSLPGVRLLGAEGSRLPILSFLVKGIHTHDIATFLDNEDIAIRAGHHCCQPLMQSLGIAGTSRASFAPFNTVKDIDRLVAGVDKTIQFFK